MAKCCHRLACADDAAMKIRTLREKLPPGRGRIAAEWQARCDLAALYRIVDHVGWTDVINTHMSARVIDKKGADYRSRRTCAAQADTM